MKHTLKPLVILGEDKRKSSASLVMIKTTNPNLFPLLSTMNLRRRMKPYFRRGRPVQTLQKSRDFYRWQF